MKNMFELKLLKVRMGTWIGLLCITGGAFLALYGPMPGAALMLLGTLLVVVSVRNDAQQVLQMNLLKMRVGAWIALLFMAVGGVIATHRVATGTTFILFGLLISISMGRHPRPAGHRNETSTK